MLARGTEGAATRQAARKDGQRFASSPRMATTAECEVWVPCPRCGEKAVTPLQHLSASGEPYTCAFCGHAIEIEVHDSTGLIRLRAVYQQRRHL
jgi:predicted RNA-binding Zn-ribbon protein involved in translation (DUF1610 family)